MSYTNDSGPVFCPLSNFRHRATTCHNGGLDDIKQCAGGNAKCFYVTPDEFYKSEFAIIEIYVYCNTCNKPTCDKEVDIVCVQNNNGINVNHSVVVFWIHHLHYKSDDEHTCIIGY